MARVSILGASGKLGELLVARALAVGHTVRALVRDPRKIKRQNEQLTVIMGDAETGEGLDAAVEGCKYVISALGSLKPTMAKCITQVARQLEGQKHLERFVLISRLGAGDSLSQSSKVSGPIQSHLPLLLMPVFRDINAAEAIVRVSRIPYTILRTTRLTDDPPTGNVVVTEPSDEPPHRLGRADFANFVIDMLDKPNFSKRELTIGSK